MTPFLAALQHSISCSITTLLLNLSIVLCFIWLCLVLSMQSQTVLSFCWLVSLNWNSGNNMSAWYLLWSICCNVGYYIIKFHLASFLSLKFSFAIQIYMLVNTSTPEWHVIVPRWKLMCLWTVRFWKYFMSAPNIIISYIYLCHLGFQSLLKSVGKGIQAVADIFWYHINLCRCIFCFRFHHVSMYHTHPTNKMQKRSLT